MKKVVFFTGAGVSEESGIDTFRSNNGLWDNFNVNEVATSYAYKSNPVKVLDFYNYRRNKYINCKPNHAHELIAAMEKDYDVAVITQNVDKLHEEAGSTNVLHLHGTMDLRSELSPNQVFPYDKDIFVGDLCPNGGQLRPNIVMFGENLDSAVINNSLSLIQEADILIIIGTSLHVAPACYYPQEASESCEIYYIDPNASQLEEYHKMNLIKEKACDGMDIVYNLLNEKSQDENNN